jgi:membrane protease YdiL (CAAX protease family)
VAGETEGGGAADRDASGEIPRADRATRARFLTVASGVVVTWGLHNGLLLPWELRNVDATIREPSLVAVRALLWMLPALWYLGRCDPRDRRVALGVTSRPRWRGLALGALIGAAYLLLVVALLRATAEPSQANAALLPLGVLYMLLNAALEELFMRGFVLGQLVRFTSSLRAQACVALLFGLVHLPAWIGVSGIHIGLIPSFFMVTLLGAVLGGVTRLSSSIWPAIVVHFVNNLLAELLG